MGPESGEPLSITCEASRKYGHMLRRDYGAVLVGRQTILKDDPMLNIRYDIEHPEDRPVRIVLDPQLRISVNSKIMNTGGNVLIYTANDISSILKKKVESKGGHIVPMSDGNGKIDLDALAKDLYERGICAVLIEGGANTV
ncbi:MAG: RibD family protein, partial [Firmicutes bacterium]|nr:RibD family protein [Bacillota bacterium]